MTAAISTPMIIKLMYVLLIKKPTHFCSFTSCAFIFFLFFLENNKYTTGNNNQVTKKEHTSVMIMELVITLKYAPATPDISTKGRKITMVLNEEPTMAGNR